MRASSQAASVRNCRLAPLRNPTCCGTGEAVLLLSFVTDGKCRVREIHMSASKLRCAGMVVLLVTGHAAVAGKLRPVACDTDLATFASLMGRAEMKDTRAPGVEGLSAKSKIGKLVVMGDREWEKLGIPIALDYSKSDLDEPDLLLTGFSGGGRFGGKTGPYTAFAVRGVCHGTPPVPPHQGHDEQVHGENRRNSHYCRNHHDLGTLRRSRGRINKPN